MCATSSIFLTQTANPDDALLQLSQSPKEALVKDLATLVNFDFGTHDAKDCFGSIFPFALSTVTGHERTKAEFGNLLLSQQLFYSKLRVSGHIVTNQIIGKF
jgi:hypothetical protein